MINLSSSLRHKARQAARGVLVLLILLSGLILAVSLASAGRTAGWMSTQVQLLNVASQPRPVTITWYTVSGAPVLPIVDTLAGGHSNFYSPTFHVTGTIHVDGASQILGAVTHWDQAGGAAQWPLVDDADLGHTAYVPYFTLMAGGPSWRLSIHNLETLEASAVITFFDSSGVVIHTWTGPVLPKGALLLDAAEIGFPMGAEASAVIQADQSIYVGIDRIYSPGFSSAQAQSRGGYKLVAPVFVVQYVDPNSVTLNSTMVVQNTGRVTATITLTYYATDGSVLASPSFSAAPFAAIQWDGGGAPPGTLGYVIAEADQPVAGLVLGNGVSSADLWDYTAVIVQPEQPDRLDRRSAYGPAVYANYEGWVSQIPVVNLSANPASVTIRYTAAPTGAVLIEQMDLPGLAMGMLDVQALPYGFEHASASVLSNQPVASMIWSVNSSGAGVDRYTAYEAQYARTAPVGGYMVLPADQEDNVTVAPAAALAVLAVIVAALAVWQARRRWSG